MAKNLRAKIPASDTLIVRDVNELCAVSRASAANRFITSSLTSRTIRVSDAGILARRFLAIRGALSDWDKWVRD
jgi:hypothetical protein